MTSAAEGIAAELRRAGFASVGTAQMRALLPQAVAGWEPFAASWDDLGMDTYMADGGRYRRRRFSAFTVSTRSPFMSQVTALALLVPA